MLALLLMVALATAAPTMKYTTGGAVEDLSPAEIAARVLADPEARHLVWQPGMITWTPATRDVAVLAQIRAARAARATPAVPPSPTAARPPASPPTPAAAVDPAEAIRSHLRSLDASAAHAPPPAPPPLEPTLLPGEGDGVLFEPPPLPGSTPEFEIEELPAD